MRSRRTTHRGSLQRRSGELRGGRDGGSAATGRRHVAQPLPAPLPRRAPAAALTPALLATLSVAPLPVAPGSLLARGAGASRHSAGAVVDPGLRFDGRAAVHVIVQ